MNDDLIRSLLRPVLPPGTLDDVTLNTDLTQATVVVGDQSTTVAIPQPLSEEGIRGSLDATTLLGRILRARTRLARRDDLTGLLDDAIAGLEDVKAQVAANTRLTPAQKTQATARLDAAIAELDLAAPLVVRPGKKKKVAARVAKARRRQ